MQSAKPDTDTELVSATVGLVGALARVVTKAVVKEVGR